MDNIFLDRMISKPSQLRIVIGLLCMLVLYTLLQNIDSLASSDVSVAQRICYIFANTIVFFYLYKFIRYDLGTRMSFVFIGIIVFINAYYIASLMSTSILGFDLIEDYSIQYGISILRLLAIISVGIRLILNKYNEKKIQRIIQIVGAFLLLQLIVPIATSYIFLGVFGFELIYRWVCVFFDLMPYIAMMYLYISVLDQPVAEKEL